MRILPMLCRFGCLLLFGGGPAAASVEVLDRSGPWQAFQAVSADGSRLCGIEQYGDGAYLSFKLDQNRNAFIHLAKLGWVVPRSARIDTLFEVDGKDIAALDFTGTANALMIESQLQPDQVAGLFESFAAGHLMKVRFLSGNEQPWSFRLNGTYRLTQSFFRCAQAMPVQTQPFDAVAVDRSQPF